MTAYAKDLRVLSSVPGQFYEVTRQPGVGPIGRVALRADGSFSAFWVEAPDDKRFFDTEDDALASLLGEPR